MNAGRLGQRGQTTDTTSPGGRAISIAIAALFFGGLWGICEATLGYLLHLLPRILPVPSISGAILFPVGFLFMYSAYRAVGSPKAVLATAAVAAAVKMASLAIPGVTLPFVLNPAIAILLEGLVSFILVAALALGPAAATLTLRPAPATLALATAASLAWRLLFLLGSLVLGIRSGILAKGTGPILSYLFLESAVNGLLIYLGFQAAPLVRARRPMLARRLLTRRLLTRPASGAIAGAAAIGVQVLFSLL